MLNVTNKPLMLSVITLNVVMLSVTMLSVEAPILPLPSRHDRFCLKVFLKRDKLEQSSMETPFNEIFRDGEKVEKSQSSIV